MNSFRNQKVAPLGTALAGALLLALVFTGCDADMSNQMNTNDEVSGIADIDASGGVDSGNGDTELSSSVQVEFDADIEQQMTELRAEIRDLNARAENLSENAQGEAAEMLSAIDEQMAELDTELDQLQNVTGNAWDTAAQNVENGVGVVASSIEDAWDYVTGFDVDIDAEFNTPSEADADTSAPSSGNRETTN